MRFMLNHRDGHREHLRGHGEARGMFPGETTPKPRGEVSTGVGEVRGRDASPQGGSASANKWEGVGESLLRESSAGQEMAEDNEERHRGAKAEQAFSGQEAYIPLASGSQTGMLQNSRTVWVFFDHRLLVFSPRVPQIQ